MQLFHMVDIQKTATPAGFAPARRRFGPRARQHRDEIKHVSGGCPDFGSETHGACVRKRPLRGVSRKLFLGPGKGCVARMERTVRGMHK